MGGKATKLREKSDARQSETVGSGKSDSAAVSCSKIPPATEGQRQLLDDPRSLSQLAKELGVSKATVGHWRTGRYKPERADRLRLEGHLGIPAAAWDKPPGGAPVAPSSAGSTCSGSSDDPDEKSGIFSVVADIRTRRQEAADANDERDWTEWAGAERLCLESRCETLAAEVGDLDKLRCSPAYGEARSAVLAAIDDDVVRTLVQPLLPEQPSIGPLVELEGIRADLGTLAGEAEARSRDAVGNVTAKEVTGLLRVSLDSRKVSRRFGALVAPGELAESRPWLAIVSAVSSALRAFVGVRQAVLDSVGRLGANPLAVVLLETLTKVRHLAFPCEDFRKDPVRFCLEVLGFLPWSRQREILEAIRDHKYVAIRSGQKTGKSRIVGAAAIWWFCCWDDGAVLFSNSTGKQLDGINWKEIKHLVNDSGRCAECVETDPKGPRPCQHSQVVDGELLKSARGGLHSGKRSILGVQAKDAEGIQGFSGNHLLVIVDEGSSLVSDLYQAFFGNTAAEGAKMVMVSNPTRQSGPFFDAFHRNKSQWHTIQISSLEAAAEGVPGLASLQYCIDVLNSDERREKSPFYQVRVLGDFPSKDTAAAYPLETILAAQEAWDTTDCVGRLVIAIDPAGESGNGDDIAMVWGRGDKISNLTNGVGWNLERYRAEVMAILEAEAKGDSEKPLVAVDADGVGYEVHRALRALADETKAFEVVPIYFGHKAHDWRNYDLTGDEAHVALSKWLRGGGTISVGWSKLEQELQIVQWLPVRRKRFDREITVFSATRKADIRKELHRSPDSLDACRIWAYAQTKRIATEPEKPAEPPKQPTAYETQHRAARAMDPYASLKKWR